MLKTCFFFLLSLISLGSSEMLQYCSNIPQGYLGYYNAHFGQVMTPSVNKGIIYWVSVYTSRYYNGSPVYRPHRIELWRYNGVIIYGKFCDVEVHVPIGIIGWYTTNVNQAWDGGTEQSFVAVMQTEQYVGNPYNWSQSQIGYDRVMQGPSEMVRNWQAGPDEQWSILPGDFGNLMFKVGFEPDNPEIAPVSLGQLKANFH